jgi:hypothetical protein
MIGRLSLQQFVLGIPISKAIYLPTQGFAVGITAMLEPCMRDLIQTGTCCLPAADNDGATVKRIGLGKDIWRLPFENISRVLFVRLTK